MYKLVTDRLELKLSHPRYAKEVSEFHKRNKEAFVDTEPTRSEQYYTKSGQKYYLKEELKDAKKLKECRYWISLKGEDKIIGTVSISQIYFGSVQTCYLSYKIDHKYQNTGICTEAVQEIISFAFEVLQLHRIEVAIMPRNLKSLRVVEKLNFEYEGISREMFEVNGVYEDHKRFALINKE